ncbi:MAG: glycosyltransferase, partial [Alphaproteobacteria bacterium]|nr:glycosyltransferase [Alphaproteobacteria bacterium]
MMEGISRAEAMHICSIITSFAAGGAEVLATNLTGAFVNAGHRSTIIALCDAAAVGNSEEYEQALKQTIRRGGGDVRSLALVNRRNLWTGAIAMRRAIWDIDPDIIHVHTPQALLMLLLAGVRRPTVYTHHNIRCNFPLWLFHVFDRVVDRYIAIGEACRNLLESVVRKPLILIRNGVPETFSIAAPRMKLAR